MADIAASDLTYTLQEGTQNSCPSDPLYKAVFKIAFGDGALTYPSGGIPLTPGKLGCPSHLQEFVIMDSSDADGLVYKYDRENGKIRIYKPQGAHSHPLLLKEGAVADGATTRVNAGTDLLGANAGSDITVAGGGANGGVQASTASAGDELGNVAVAATVLYAKVVGW